MNKTWMKGLMWMVAVIFILAAVLSLVGRPGMYIGHYYGHHGGLGGYDGQAYFIVGYRPMELGALHFIGSLLCIAFWVAVILLFMAWLYKRRNSHRPSGYSIMDTSHFSHTYSQSPHHVDFLDEWEENQRKHKEE